MVVGRKAVPAAGRDLTCDREGYRRIILLLNLSIADVSEYDGTVGCMRDWRRARDTASHQSSNKPSSDVERRFTASCIQSAKSTWSRVRLHGRPIASPPRRATPARLVQS